MTTTQKHQITDLRQRGLSYAEIAVTVGIPQGTVKSFCWRNRIAKSGVSDKCTKNLCQNCGHLLIQQPDAPPRKFCNDKCRFDWWGKNRKPNQSAICLYCNGVFFYYGRPGRKYCTHTCSIKHRFGEVLA